jgi:hypothetical protein
MRPPTCAVRVVTRLIDRYAHEPEGISYWKREALAFSSGLLIGWPGPPGTGASLRSRGSIEGSAADLVGGPGKAPARMPHGRLNSLLQRPTTSVLAAQWLKWRGAGWPEERVEMSKVHSTGWHPMPRPQTRPVNAPSVALLSWL